MKYRDIIGHPKKKEKKKVIPEQPKPSVTELLKEEFGGKLNEGPAYEYADYIKKIENNYDAYWDAVKEFQKVLDGKGLKGASKGLGNAYKNLVLKFHKLFGKLVDKLL